MISFSGHGATGPKKHYIAYGPVQVPMTGLASVSGYPGRGPSEFAFPTATRTPCSTRR
jgi:hypothetical protein